MFVVQFDCGALLTILHLFSYTGFWSGVTLTNPLSAILCLFSQVAISGSYPDLDLEVFNMPGVAGAVLQKDI